MTADTAYVIQQARPRDVPAVMGLLAEATRWLHEVKELDQWQGPTDRREALVRRDVGVRAVWVVRHLGHVVATLTVDHLADADFWRSTDRVRSALYVHRMAVAREAYAGIGLGASMLDWAAERVVRSGRRHLRLDAWRTNQALHDYYQRLGFEMLRDDLVEGRGSGALFERPASVRMRTGPPLVAPAAARSTAPAASVPRHGDERLSTGGDLVPA